MIKQTYNAPIDTEMNERQEKPITPNFDCVTANCVKSTTAPCYYGIDPFKDISRHEKHAEHDPLTNKINQRLLISAYSSQQFNPKCI